MSFSDPEALFRGILASIEHIRTFLDGFDLPAFRSNLLTRSAVERQLQILTEAASRLQSKLIYFALAPIGRRFVTPRT